LENDSKKTDWEFLNDTTLSSSSECFVTLGINIKTLSAKCKSSYQYIVRWWKYNIMSINIISFESKIFVKFQALYNPCWLHENFQVYIARHGNGILGYKPTQYWIHRNIKFLTHLQTLKLYSMRNSWIVNIFRLHKILQKSYGVPVKALL
jgi:hypothetical protein